MKGLPFAIHDRNLATKSDLPLERILAASGRLLNLRSISFATLDTLRYIARYPVGVRTTLC